MIDPVAMDRLAALRKRLFTAIEQTLSVEGHCKSYEGTFSIVLPSYFEDRDGAVWGVTLDLYVIGPHRHYAWDGPTLDAAVVEADAEVSKWLASHDKWWAEHGGHTREGMCGECDSYREFAA